MDYFKKPDHYKNINSSASYSIKKNTYATYFISIYKDIKESVSNIVDNVYNYTLGK